MIICRLLVLSVEMTTYVTCDRLHCYHFILRTSVYESYKWNAA